MQKIRIKDRVINLSKAQNSVLDNDTILTFDEETNICLVEKTVEFICFDEYSDTLPAKLSVSIPFPFKEKEIRKMNELISELRTHNEKYQYYDMINFDSKKRLTEIHLSVNEKYIMPSDNSYLTELSKIYMPEVVKYCKLDKLKFK